ncbi:MAG: hypothetical protein GY809_20465 [Planctomycetes bacterium]|nr:hypothetical protein [Planctomycetota bacterium]
MRGTDKVCLTRCGFMAMGGAGLAASLCRAWSSEPPRPKRILFIAGPSSHAFGDHRHEAGCQYLAHCLNASSQIKAEVMADHWPGDSVVFADVDAVVIYVTVKSGLIQRQTGLLQKALRYSVFSGHYSEKPCF